MSKPSNQHGSPIQLSRTELHANGNQASGSAKSHQGNVWGDAKYGDTYGGDRVEGTKYSDTISGDKFGGDKVAGDKVAGDKIGHDKVQGDQFRAGTATYNFARSASARKVRPKHTLPPKCGGFIEPPMYSEIREKCAGEGSPVAVVGIEGIGKSRVAMEYAYECVKQDSDLWAFCVDARSAESFVEGYRQIAEVTGLATADVGRTTLALLSAVCQKLDDQSHKWIMVIDGLDDYRVVHDFVSADAPSSKTILPVIGFLPSRGRMLITSRNRNVLQWMSRSGPRVFMQPVKTPDAIEILKYELQLEKSSETVVVVLQQLATELGCIPGALVRAAMYFENNGRLTSLPPTPEPIRIDENQLERILSLAAKTDGAHQQTLEYGETMWQSSFAYIHAQNHRAAELLSLMSMFHHRGVPPQALQRWNNIDIDINKLHEHMLVEYDNLRKSYSVHRPVQIAVRKWIRDQGKSAESFRDYISIVYDAISDLTERSASGGWVNEQLAPPQSLCHPDGDLKHVETCWTSCGTDDKTARRKHLAILSFYSQHVLPFGCDLVEAGRIIERALEIAQITVPLDDESRLRLNSARAGLLYAQGNQETGYEAVRSARDAKARKYGWDHPELCQDLENLEYIYTNQGRHAEAAEVLKKQLKLLNEKSCIPKARAWFRLAIVQSEQGKRGLQSVNVDAVVDYLTERYKLHSKACPVVCTTGPSTAAQRLLANAASDCSGFREMIEKEKGYDDQVLRLREVEQRHEKVIGTSSHWTESESDES